MSGTSPDIVSRAAADSDQPPLVPILLALGQALSRRRRHREAIEALRQALAEPEDKPVELLTGALLDELLVVGDPEAALKASLELAPGAPAATLTALRRLNPLSRPALLRSAAEEVAATDWAGLVAGTDRAVAVRRGLLTFAVQAHLILRDPRRASALLDDAADLVDGDAELLVLLGDCRLSLREPGPAEDAWLRAESAAATSRPGLIEPINLRLARVYEQVGEPAKALHRLQAIPPTASESAADLYAVKALVLLQTGERSAALEAVHEAQERSPDSAAVAQAGACVFLAHHRYDEAKAAADAGLGRYPDHQGLSFLRFQAVVEAGEDLVEIDGRLSRFLARMAHDELDECVTRSVRVRPPDDPALHYFLGMLHRAMDRPADALAEVEAAIGLIGEEGTDTERRMVEVRARRLRGLLLEPDRPAAAAEEYAAAGRLAWEQEDFELAVGLLTSAVRLGDADQASRWRLVDALLAASYVATEPNGVSVSRIRTGLEVWQEAIDRELPDMAFAWAYLSRALLGLQLARVEPDRYRLVTEALAYCECFYVLNEGSDPFLRTIRHACRLLGLYGVSTDLLTIAATPPVPDYLAEPPLEDLVTSAANAGDFARMESGLQLYERNADETGSATGWREALARYHILRRDAAAARTALDAVAVEDRSQAFHVWLRILTDWLLGDLDAVERDLTTAGHIASETVDDDSGLVAWMHLLSGAPEGALATVSGRPDEDSWLTDSAAEAALCRVVGRVPDNADGADEAELRRYVDETRSFEDLVTFAAEAGLLAWRYGDTADGTLRRSADLAQARLDEGLWPLTAEADLKYLLAASTQRADGGWAGVAARAGLARLAADRREWTQAIRLYRELIPHLDRFPEVEMALVLLADRLTTVADTQPAQVAAVLVQLEEALPGLRAYRPRRTSVTPLDMILGDIWVELGEFDRAWGLYASLAARPELINNEGLAYLLGRQHIVAVVLGRPDAQELLTRAVPAYQRAELAPAANIYETATTFVKTEPEWRRLAQTWAGAAAEAAGDLADDLTQLSLAGRHGLGLALQAQGRWQEAEAEHRAVLAWHQQRYGDEHVDTLASRYELAWALYNRGDLDAALAEYRTVVAGRRAVLGDDDATTLAARRELALTLVARGDEAAAEAEYQAVVAGYVRTLDGDDPTLLRTRFELAGVLNARGNLAEAEAEYRAVAAGRGRALGADDPETLAVRYELAGMLDSRGDVEAAFAEYRAVADGRAERLGTDDPDTLVARQQAATMLRLLGRPDEAEPEFRDVLAAQRAALGDDHPVTLGLRHQLGMTLVAQGHLDPGVDELRLAVEGRSRVLGDDDPATLRSRFELAGALAARGDLAEAEVAYRAVVAGRVSGLGADDPATLTARYELAGVLSEQADWDGAEVEYRAVVAGCSRTLGPDHLDTLLSRYHLATALAEQGRLDDAEAEYRAVLERERQVRGADDPSTLVTWHQLARVLAGAGDWDRAGAEYRGVVAARGRILGPEHPDTLASRSGLAWVLQNRGEPQDAESEYRAVLAAQVATLGADDIESLRSRVALASFYLATARPADAEVELRTIITACDRLVGPDHPDTVLSRYQLASALANQGRLSEAEVEYRAVLELERRVQGEDDPSTLVTWHQLARVLAAAGDWDRAEAEYRGVLEARSRVLGDDDSDTVASRRGLERVIEDRARSAPETDPEAQGGR
ncbi:MAG: tetratricopeptide repeat protein [Actinobacteria bacterium]|nr:MAG: tetratricopeptide repeat protein [Actinomycetota bacterium]